MSAAIIALMIFLLQFAVADKAREARRAGVVMASMIALYAIGLISLVLLPLGRPQDWMILAFTAIAVSLGAAFFGFLFGLPHSVPQNNGQQTAGGAILTSSTNLEQVADQLTKFITGAAFASIAVAAGYIDTVGQFISKAMGASPPSWQNLVGDMIIVYYGALGFMIAYILTRTVGGFEFMKADQALLGQGESEILWTLPDVGASDATPDQKALAERIASLPWSAAKDESERITWARAQTIAGSVDKARSAYTALYATDPKNPDVLIELGTTLYNDLTFDDFNYIIQLADKASAIVSSSDERRQCRIVALRAATYLYLPGGYVKTIEVVNAFLKTGMAGPKSLHFYRACALGQLFRAYYERGQLNPPAGAALAQRITMDSIVTLGFGDYLRDQIISVADPSHRAPADASDDDLQCFASVNPTFWQTLGLQAQPPAPSADTLPDLVTLPANQTPDDYAAGCPA